MVAYKSSTDKSLKSKRGEAFQYFKPTAVKKIIDGRPIKPNDFRVKSIKKISLRSKKILNSGMHESVGTSSFMVTLSDRKSGFDSKSQENSLNSKDHSVPPENIRILVELADIARVDTAGTILSAPKGIAAGHTHSGVSTTDQDKAHALLDSAMSGMLEDADTAKVHPTSVAIVFSAITSLSSAPAVVVNKKYGGFNEVADLDKLETSRWEEIRNEIKARTQKVVDKVSKDFDKTDIDFINRHTTVFKNSLEDESRENASSKFEKKKKLPPVSLGSPQRETRKRIKENSLVDGGDYTKKKDFVGPEIEPPDVQARDIASAKEHLLYMLQPGRRNLAT